MSLFEELKRRNVIRVGIAYVLLGWVVLQAADFALDLVDAPNWIIQVFFIAGLIGLPFALFFSWAFEVTPEGIKREEDVDRSSSVTPQTGRKLDKAIIAFLALAVILLLVDRQVGDRDVTPAAEDGATPTTEVASETAPAKSVAVLPFADLSQAKDQEWFADGLAEEILNALAKTPDLLVASRTSAFSYKGQNKDILEIAEELGVAHVLEGSVRSSGDRIRVTAQLIRASDGFHLWSENYDRNPEDMIAIQEDLARSIAEALETTMDPTALAAMSQVGTRSVEAYKAFLEGVANNLGNVGAGNEELLEALDAYQRATTADPGFAEAYVRQADWWKAQLTPSYLLSGATELSVEGLMAEFTKAIDLAIENAASDVDRRGYLAQKAEVEVRLRDALSLYGEYLDERPNDYTALIGLATVADMAGNQAALDRAFDLIRERGQRDPEAAVIYIASAYDQRDPDEVADYGLERLEQWPDSRGLLYQAHRALMWAGRTEEGASLLRRYNLSYPPQVLMEMRQACIEGRRDDAQAAFEQLERGDDDQWRSIAWLALKMLGEDVEAARMLEPISRSASPYQLSTTLGYSIFDPTPYPELMNILEREGVLRGAPKTLPYRCPPPDQPSIAVLPFRDMSPTGDQAWFGEGIAEELLNALVRVDGLEVASRTSAFALANQNLAVSDIGDQLEVAHVLEGSIRTAGDRIRITAQLIDVETDKHLWSEVFDRQADDIFAIQDEITAATVEALQGELGVGEQVSVSQTTNVEAYNAFLRGRYAVIRRNHDMAIDNLREAVRLDPNYAAAWANLGLIGSLTTTGNPLASRLRVQLTRDEVSEIVERAIELDPNQALAYTARGHLRATEWDWAAAAADHRRALALDPTNADAHHFATVVVLIRGDLMGALELSTKSVALDPQQPMTTDWLGRYHMGVGHYDEAARYFQRAIDLGLRGYGGQASTDLGDLAYLRGDQETANRIWAGLLSDDQALINRATLMLRMDRREEAEALLAEANKAGDSPDLLFAYYAMQDGDVNEAVRRLELSAEKLESPGLLGYFLIRYVPHFPELQEHPGFHAWLEDNDIVLDPLLLPKTTES